MQDKRLTPKQIETQIKKNSKAIWKSYVDKCESYDIDTFKKLLSIKRRCVVTSDEMTLTYKYDQFYNLEYVSYERARN